VFVLYPVLGFEGGDDSADLFDVSEDLEAGAAFWHMCDLIWLLLFPALYLIF